LELAPWNGLGGPSTGLTGHQGGNGLDALCWSPVPPALNTSARFDRHATHSDIPLLVDFWAAWCGPCRAMAPIFEQAAPELEPNLRMVKVDADAAPDLRIAFRFRVSRPWCFFITAGRLRVDQDF
jgi:thiol-disulfide isomerase/thioredoxin